MSPGSVADSVKLSGRTADNARCPDPTRSSGRSHTKMVPSSAVMPSSVAMPRQKLLRPMNPATNADTGRSYTVSGITELLDVTLEHDGDSVAHAHCFFLIVSDEDERDAELALQQLQLDLHLLAELAVECAERLVEQQHAGPVDECTGNCNALLLATRHLPRPAFGELGHLDHSERFVDPAGHLGFRHPLLPQAVGDVLGNGHVRKQRVAPGRRC